MAFTYRGVIEGFYGRPWTHEERLDMIAWMGRHHFNAYLYAPKDDELHRRRWREPYQDADVERFRELAERGREVGVELIWAISPGLSLVYSDPAELDRLWEKVTTFIPIGVRTFGLFFDDIPPRLTHESDQRRYTGHAQAQADFTRRLWQRLKEHEGREGQAGDRAFRLIVCPTHYCADPDVPYLHELGSGLDPAIDIFWTGPAVCSREITRRHVESVASVMRRPPLIWDNYPVNDGHMASELHVGPYAGRDPHLDQVCRGIFANPMNQPLASRLPLATIGQYLADPRAYEPESAWREAARELLRPDSGAPAAGADLSAFETFAACESISCLRPDDPEFLVSTFRRWEELLWSFHFDEAGRMLNESVARMREARAWLDRALPTSRLLREMRPWIEDFGRWVDALDCGLDVLSREAAVWADEDGEEHRARCRDELRQARKRLGDQLKDAVDWPTRTCGDAARSFLQHLYRRSRAAAGGSP